MYLYFLAKAIIEAIQKITSMYEGSAIFIRTIKTERTKIATLKSFFLNTCKPAKTPKITSGDNCKSVAPPRADKTMIIQPTKNITF